MPFRNLAQKRTCHSGLLKMGTCFFFPSFLKACEGRILPRLPSPHHSPYVLLVLNCREVCHQKQPFLLGLWVEKLEQEMETCERNNHVTQPSIQLLYCGWESITALGAALPAELGLCSMIPLWI